MDERINLWESKNGKWSIGKLNGRFYIFSNNGNNVCDFPIIYNDGSIAFDYPEKLPQYIKNQFKKIIKK